MVVQKKEIVVILKRNAHRPMSILSISLIGGNYIN